MTTEPTTPAPPSAPDPRQPAYDAVYAYIRTLPRGDVERNAMIWRGVNAALDAVGVATGKPAACGNSTGACSAGEWCCKGPATPAPSASRDTMREAIEAAVEECRNLIPSALADAVMTVVDAGNLEHAAACSGEPATDLNDGGLRERYADAIDAVFEQWTTGLGETRPQAALTDAVLAVRDGDVEQLRDQLAQVEDLLRIAHDTSNRSEAERARAVRRAEEAEALVAAVRAKATEWAALAPADDWGESPGSTQLADVGRHLLALTAPAGPGGQGDGGGKWAATA